MPRRATILLAVLGWILPSTAPARPREPSADSLVAHARTLLLDSRVESRRLAIQELERATQLAPRSPEAWRAYAAACKDAGLRDLARRSFERLERLVGADADAELEIGDFWKWDWLNSLDDDSFQSAARWLERSARARPERLEAWMGLASLALVRGNGLAAAEAGVGAHHADPDSPFTSLILACAAYHLGAIHQADSLFRDAIPRLTPDQQARFDPKFVGGEALSDTKTGVLQPLARDPDLTTPENEVELDFWSRVAHVLMLFRDGDRLRWDVRSELIVRYGMPATIRFNRPDKYLYWHPPLSGNMEFPYDEQVWSYPTLGRSFELWDRSLVQNYQFAYVDDRPADPLPNPAAVERRGDRVALGGGRGVFRTLSPGAHPIRLQAEVDRFPTPDGTRLVAHLLASGRPGDTLIASWAVENEAGLVIARDRQPFTISACAPESVQSAEFAAEAPPGAYRLDLAVADRQRGRGVVHRSVVVDPRRSGMTLSDLVVICGTPETNRTDRAIRLDPNIGRRVGSERSFSAYFEVSGLSPDPEGNSRFRYQYTVRPKDRDGEIGRVMVDVSRDEEFRGALRRQFVTVPLSGAPRGDLRLEVTVTDLVGGATAHVQADFTKGN